MMRLICSGAFISRSLVSIRGFAEYGMQPLSHEQLHKMITTQEIKSVNNISGGNANKSILELLENIETHISNWRLNRWEFRVPLTLTGGEKEQIRQQQDLLKSFCIEHSKTRECVQNDVQLVSQLTNTPCESVREKSRNWLENKIAEMRWRGEVNNAVKVRDAFLRLEVYGAREFRLLERLCCVYGLALQNTFFDAFTNTIKHDATCNRLYVDENNPFTTLVTLLLSEFHDIHIIYDFLGFAVGKGYRMSLLQFMTEVLRRRDDNNMKGDHNVVRNKKNSSTAKSENDKIIATSTSKRILYSSELNNEVLFNYADSCKRIEMNDTTYGLPDLLYIKDNNVFLITIASENWWLRNRQLPHKKQMEGIARRASFVFGLPYERVRIRNILLPPQYLDKASLLRLLQSVLSLSIEESRLVTPWLDLYNKELDSNDVDYCELAKTVNEEEWLTLETP